MSLQTTSREPCTNGTHGAKPCTTQRVQVLPIMRNWPHIGIAYPKLLVHRFSVWWRRRQAVTDWRIDIQTFVAKQEKKHKEGAAVYKVSVTKNSDGQLFSFITPSPIAMYMNLSLAHCRSAAKLKGRFRYRHETQGNVQIKALEDTDTPILLDYFEDVMVVIICSFQALEFFCNQVISDSGAQNFELTGRNDKKRFVDFKDLQRECSISDKLSNILPRLLNRDSPKGTQLWQRFKTIKDRRDSIVHLKGHEAYVRGDEAYERSSIFYEFLHVSLTECITVPLDLIEHFKPGIVKSRWFVLAREQLQKI